MRKLVKAAAALTAGCMLLSTSAFAAADCAELAAGLQLDGGVAEFVVDYTTTGQSTILVLPKDVEPSAATDQNILYINQAEIVDGKASYKVNLGAAFADTADVWVGGTNEGTATKIGTLKGVTPLTGITLATETPVIAVDGTATINPTYIPDTATNKALTWTSSDNAIATVADGVVTANAVGKVTITATSVADETVKGTIDITVASLALDKNVAEVVIGESVAITATVAPADTAIVWSESENLAVSGNVATFTVPETATAGDTFEVTATVGTITEKVTITAAAKAQEPEETLVVTTIKTNPYRFGTAYSLIKLVGNNVGAVTITDSDGNATDAYLVDYSADGGVCKYVAIVKKTGVTLDDVVIDSTSAAKTLKFGDVKPDNRIRVADASMCFDKVMGATVDAFVNDVNKATLSADVNLDGNLRVADASMIFDNVMTGFVFPAIN